MYDTSPLSSVPHKICESIAAHGNEYAHDFQIANRLDDDNIQHYLDALVSSGTLERITMYKLTSAGIQRLDKLIKKTNLKLINNMRSVEDIAEEVVQIVQAGLADKINPVKLNREVAAHIKKLIKSTAETMADAEYIVAVQMDAGVPMAISSNNPALAGALFVCTDSILVAEDEDTAVIVQDDTIVVSIGEVSLCDDTEALTRAARKFSRMCSN